MPGSETVVAFVEVQVSSIQSLAACIGPSILPPGIEMMAENFKVGSLKCPQLHTTTRAWHIHIHSVAQYD